MVLKAFIRIALSLLCAGVFYVAWLAVFLVTAGGPADSSIIQAILWLSAPVITAAGFAAGIAISERFSSAREARFFHIFLWPLVGCAIGAGVVYWFGPMLIVFAMFAAGTASVIIREVVLHITETPTGPHTEDRER